jgi:uncharacterized repeat protein (TIGR03803 family)
MINLVNQKTVMLASAIALIFGGSPLLRANSTDQTLDTLVNFTGDNGANPETIIQDGQGNFYGTTYKGGKFNKGTIFKIPLNGAIETVSLNGANGEQPVSGLALAADGTIYGMTHKGGTNDLGTIFKISPGQNFDDASVSTLLSFSGGNGALPDSSLLISPDGTFYGTTYAGGASNTGVIFQFRPSSDSSSGSIRSLPFSGVNPGGLVRGPDGNFYGTTYGGGAFNYGTVFQLGPQGSATTLASFDKTNGANPQSELNVLPDGTIYGTAYNGGKNGLGNVFELTPHGNIVDLADFDGTNGSHPGSGMVQWSNGFFYIERLWQNMSVKAAIPQWSGMNFIGTTSTGGMSNQGTVFQVALSNSVTTLISFSGVSGSNLGTNPNSIVAGHDGNLYGTTFYGGSSNQGTLFRLMLNHIPLATPNASVATVTVRGLAAPVVSP